MDRLSSVERLLQQQADDILLLRSALSDAIRRLTNVEQPLPQTSNQVSQQVPHHYQPTPTRTAKRQEGKLSRRTFSSDGIHRMTSSPSPSSGRLTPAKLTKKWPSFSPSDHTPMNGVGGGLSNSR
ncbi:unnamed protein product [Dimorphilus gyrociliatus]|uniref:Uncharacterized protein n=1 Tax=Dimorphilus gyrociliatus TaxID=2664684 RepID=A0A7I8W1H0_9ANNE|nr:unnamed protein product [Dimorphilus gyrociliatus]